MDKCLQSNTEQSIFLFSSEIRDSFIFNIPHSSDYIPDKSAYTSDFFYDEIKILTDWYVNDLFDIGIDTQAANFSRVFCDVERFINNEPLEKYGKGFYYWKDKNNNEYRKNDENLKQEIYKNFYLPYHAGFINKINQKLEKYSIARIVDCHSFSGEEYLNSPDICIGIDEFHTPEYLEKFIINKFENMGYSVKINYPYAGSFVPQGMYKINKNVESIMIEINKKLYLEDVTTNFIHVENFNILKKNIKDIFENI
jgi:N-formylglutamate amidohydrolase